MHKFLVLISLSVLIVIHTGCNRIQEVVTPKQEQNTLKIGFIVAGERVTYPYGAEMAVTEINQQGGLLGTPVELIGHINKEAIPEISVQLAETLIVEDEVIALIGPNRSSHAAVVGPRRAAIQDPDGNHNRNQPKRNKRRGFRLYGILH